MIDYSLTDEQITELRCTYRMTPDRIFADRMKAVVLLGTGWKPEKSAEALLIDERTVRNYFVKYKSGGIGLLLSTAWQGGVSHLTQEQEDELGRYLDKLCIMRARKSLFISKSPTVFPIQ